VRMLNPLRIIFLIFNRNHPESYLYEGMTKRCPVGIGFIHPYNVED